MGSPPMTALAALAAVVAVLLLGGAVGPAGGQDDDFGYSYYGREESPPRDLHVAGLFYQDEWQEIMAFRGAINRANMDLVPVGITLVPVIEVLTTTDSFAVSRKVCNLTSSGVVAIFGPRGKDSMNIVSSIADTLEIPHLLTRLPGVRVPSKTLVNVAPDRQSLSRAIVDLLEDMAWKTFTVIYEDEEGLALLQDVLRVHGPEDSPITMRRLGDGPDYRPLLKEIQNSSETRILLDVSADRLLDVFYQARQVKLMGDYVSYLVTSLDAHTLNYDVIKTWAEREVGLSNITGIRLVDPQAMDTQNAVQDWIYKEREQRGQTITLTPREVKTSAALLTDAVHMFARSLRLLNMKPPFVEERSLSCDGVDKWEHGQRIIEFMKAMYSDPDNAERGLTGPLWLDRSAEYRRTNFTLYTVQTAEDNATGIWNASGISLFRSVEEMTRSTMELLSKKEMRVVSRWGPPYLMKKENWTEDSGNEGLRGYAVDLIEEIAQMLKFKYKFYVVKDGRYGSLKDGRWDGIIKDLLDRKADLGICDLTITYDRERAVDFTMPFMNLGISILYSVPPEKEPYLYSFLKPLSTEVWIYNAAAFLGVGLVLFVLARVTPHEWDNPHPCNPEPEELENTFTLLNSMWFVMGSVLQQGCDFLPKAPSTRMVAGLWWFFTLIMISSYTANLAAFLTAEGMNTETINSAKDLAAQSKVSYGCLEDGSTMAFFKNSNFSDYQRMWAIMSSAKPTVFTKSNEEGQSRVLSGKRDYAFFMESTTIEYQSQRECGLQMVGGQLDSKGYGIAMPRNSPYRAVISGAVLKLQEKGKLVELKEKWWKLNDDGGKCDKEGGPEDDGGQKLTMGHVGGVFLVLTWGCTGALFLSVAEFLWNTREVAIENKISPTEALMKEIRFALRCNISAKPVKHAASTPSSGSRGSGSGGSGSTGIGRSIARSLLQLNAFQRLAGGERQK